MTKPMSGGGRPSECHLHIGTPSYVSQSILYPCALISGPQDNLLGFLFTFAHQAPDKEHSAVLYARALDVCLFIQQQVIRPDGRLARPLYPQELPRLQKVLFTSATIHGMDPASALLSTATYFQALELMISPHRAHIGGGGYTTRDLILASFLAVFILSAPPGGILPAELSASLGFSGEVPTASLTDSRLDLMDAARGSGESILNAILTLGRNTMPFMLLLPEHVARLPGLLFPATAGVLPAICTLADDQSRFEPPPEDKRKESNAMTGSVLLALAKRFQDLSSTEVTVPGFGGKLNVNHSLAMIFYYLALALSPSPSTYNNMASSSLSAARIFPYAFRYHCLCIRGRNQFRSRMTNPASLIFRTRWSRG